MFCTVILLLVYLRKDEFNFGIGLKETKHQR